LPRLGSGVAVAWCANGDEAPWSTDGASAWAGVPYRPIGWALGAVGHGLVAIRERVQGHAEVGIKGLDHEGLEGDEAFSGGQRRGARMSASRT
jgi:hypothetical protein